jgi:SAM-dependent methyltransferase
MLIFLDILVFVVLLFLLYVLMFRYKAPWVPAWKNDLSRVAEMVEIEDGKTLIDLGCGNGRIIFYLAKKYPQANFVGIEISIFFYIFCRLRKIFGKYNNVKMRYGDFMMIDFNQYDYIYAFTNVKPMIQIAKKIEKEVNKELYLISYCFEVGDWEKYLIKKDKPEKKTGIYLYQYKI